MRRGAVSSMRTLLLCCVIPVLVVMTFASAFAGAEFPAAAWTTWGGLASMLTIGCFGPRIAQYLGPQLGAAMAAIKDSAIAKRRKQGDNEYEITP